MERTVPSSLKKKKTPTSIAIIHDGLPSYNKAFYKEYYTMKNPQPRKANEGQSTEPEDLGSEVCPSCDMARKEWPHKEGYQREGATYCCEGCAQGTGCTCADTDTETDYKEDTEPPDRDEAI